MIIMNKHRGIAGIECSQSDVYIDTEKNAIRVNGVIVGEYPNGDYMIEAYKHLLYAFSLEEEFDISFNYEITC